MGGGVELQETKLKTQAGNCELRAVGMLSE